MREEMIELNYSFKTSVFQISRSRARGDLRPGQDIASARGPPPSQTRHSRHSPGPRPSARGCRHSRQRREARQNIRKHRKSGDHISDNSHTKDVHSSIGANMCILSRGDPRPLPRVREPDAGHGPGGDVCRDAGGGAQPGEERERRAPGPATGTSSQSPATAGTTGPSHAESRDGGTSSTN